MFQFSSAVDPNTKVPPCTLIGANGVWGYDKITGRPSERGLQAVAFRVPRRGDMDLLDVAGQLWRQYEADCLRNNEYPRDCYIIESFDIIEGDGLAPFGEIFLGT